MREMRILTIDLEDWFHILDHDATAQPDQWEKFESRVERNTERILEMLVLANRKATFFCLGWIAARHPKLIRKIADAGHEIACHSMNHTLVYKMNPVQFKTDLTESLSVLSGITGKKILTYRAPGFSVTENTKWVFEILAETGIENDCSVFPAYRNHGGYPQFPSQRPCLIGVNGAVITEFPMSTGKILGKTIVYSGGGYFRLLPWSFIRSQLLRSEYVMTYFHPRDFDPHQPVLSSLPLKRRWMSYTGLKGAEDKFRKLLSQFAFMTVKDAALSSQKFPEIHI